MAKRFTDSDKWKKPFIRSMEAPYKLLWLYILDDCDHAGIWQVDEDVAKIKIGLEIDFKKAIEVFGNHIQIIDGGEKWFISDFIDFQYGELKPENRVHYSILQLHKKYKIKPLTSPLKGAMDKDKDKDLDKDKGEGDPKVFKDFKTSLKLLGASDNLISEWMKIRRVKKLVDTETAFKGFEMQFTKSGKSINEVLTKCIEKSWGGFESDWVDRINSSSTQGAIKPKIDISQNKYETPSF